MKKWPVVILAICLLLAACGNETKPSDSDGEGKTVGVCLAGMPEDPLGEQLRQQLELLGFTAKISFAQGDAKEQAKQAEQLLRNSQCLIIQAVDSLALLEVGVTAKEKNVPIIACDTLLMDTDWVWGCVSYDYEALGAEMAKQVIAAKKPEEKKSKLTIEFFMGTPEDNSALLLHKGAISVLQPYLDSGSLECLSGRISFEDCYVPGGTALQAETECLSRLSKNYVEEKLDICFAGTDEIAAGCRAALDGSGYTRRDWPAIVGQGGQNGQTVKDGYQLCTFEKDAFALARQCAEFALSAVNGKNPPKETTVSNHAIDVPVCYLPVTLVNS